MTQQVSVCGYSNCASYWLWLPCRTRVSNAGTLHAKIHCIVGQRNGTKDSNPYPDLQSCIIETQRQPKCALLITGSKTFRHVVESPLGLRLLYLMALALLGYGLPLSAVHLISPTSHYGPGRWPVLTTLGHQNLF